MVSDLSGGTGRIGRAAKVVFPVWKERGKDTMRLRLGSFRWPRLQCLVATSLGITLVTLFIGLPVALGAVDTTLWRAAGKPQAECFSDISQAEHIVTLTNGTPGVKSVRIVVNQTRFHLDELKDGEVRQLDVASAMLPGNDNAVCVTLLGMPGGSARIVLDRPTAVIVTNTDDSGPGSLRDALEIVGTDGTIRFASELAGNTITLTTGALVLGKNVTIDGAEAPGLKISGNTTTRVFQVNAGTTATVKNLMVCDGYGWQLAGGILNNGTLTLDHATVMDNAQATDAGDYWQGGGGIYNGSGATLNLIDSTVKNNTARWSGGGIYSFYGTVTNITRSTISGNTSNDVGGGMRSLGDFTIRDSTISGNRATGWHGGAIFHTDGDMTIASCTIAYNIAPDWAPSAIFIGSYSEAVPSLTFANSIITGNQWYVFERYASGGTVLLVSGGHNLVQDSTGAPVVSDVVVWDAMIGSLADNGGPTFTHALMPGSPAIDAADDAACSATDQRGISRPQGAHSDIGAYEAQ